MVLANCVSYVVRSGHTGLLMPDRGGFVGLSGPGSRSMVQTVVDPSLSGLARLIGSRLSGAILFDWLVWSRPSVGLSLSGLTRLVDSG